MDPKKEYNQNKRFRHLSELTEKIGEVVTAFSQPLEVVDGHEKAICRAMKLFGEEFDGVPPDVAQHFYDEWQEKKYAAVMFCNLKKDQQEILVNKVCRELDQDAYMDLEDFE